jgi:hypothetical protein
VVRIDDGLSLRIRSTIVVISQSSVDFAVKSAEHDPANPAAEEAFSINSACPRAARCGAVLVNKPLSVWQEFYQSTGRPAEAHAVLAPALQGFAPSLEMPEVAEAMLLSARLG